MYHLSARILEKLDYFSEGIVSCFARIHKHLLPGASNSLHFRLLHNGLILLQNIF